MVLLGSLWKKVVGNEDGGSRDLVRALSRAEFKHPAKFTIISPSLSSFQQIISPSVSYGTECIPRSQQDVRNTRQTYPSRRIANENRQQCPRRPRSFRVGRCEHQSHNSSIRSEQENHDTHAPNNNKKNQIDRRNSNLRTSSFESIYLTRKELFKMEMVNDKLKLVRAKLDKYPLAQDAEVGHCCVVSFSLRDLPCQRTCRRIPIVASLRRDKKSGIPFYFIFKS